MHKGVVAEAAALLDTFFDIEVTNGEGNARVDVDIVERAEGGVSPVGASPEDTVAGDVYAVVASGEVDVDERDHTVLFS